MSSTARVLGGFDYCSRGEIVGFHFQFFGVTVHAHGTIHVAILFSFFAFKFQFRFHFCPLISVHFMPLISFFVSTVNGRLNRLGLEESRQFDFIQFYFIWASFTLFRFWAWT